MSDDLYEIYAVRYARMDRRRADNFVGGDPHDGPMPMDYFVWAIVNEHRRFVVDTGFDARAATSRKRELLMPVEEGLAAIGLDHNAIDDVILTHLHYDHAGNNQLFPRARFHVQHCEMSYANGPCMCHKAIQVNYDVEDVVTMVRRNFAGRVEFYQGEAEFAPGITLHRLGGHSPGMQVVRVKTGRGWVVLASDASHFYANMEEDRAFPALHNHSDVLQGYKTLRRLASSPAHIIPGHDPRVLERYPVLSDALAGRAVWLDLPQIGA